MSVNPIDIVKTQEAAQYKHMEMQREQHAHNQINQSFQTMIKEQHQKPQGTNKTDTPEFRYDAKEKGSNQYYGSGGNKKKKKEDTPKAEKQPPKGGGFDILI